MAGRTWLATAAVLQVAAAAVPATQERDAVLSWNVHREGACSYRNARYSSSDSWPVNASDAESCQKLCAADLRCAYFAFGPLGGAARCSLVPESPVAYTDVDGADFVTGPKVCSSPPVACSERPSPAFPGALDVVSRQAWPSHRVPFKLECWPVTADGSHYEACSTLTVLEDVQGGWPGQCSDFKSVTPPWGETCQSSCEKSVLCSAWAELAPPEPNLDRDCYQLHLTPGTECYGPSTRTMVAGQRLLHGAVRVLKDLTGVEVVGLREIFDTTHFAIESDAIQACKNACYSDAACDYWQYSSSAGCLAEDVSEARVQFPLTLSSYLSESPMARSVVAGEFIQHLCPSARTPFDYVAVAKTARPLPATGVASEGLSTPVADKQEARSLVHQHTVLLLGCALAVATLLFLSCVLCHKVQNHGADKKVSQRALKAGNRPLKEKRTRRATLDTSAAEAEATSRVHPEPSGRRSPQAEAQPLLVAEAAAPRLPPSATVAPLQEPAFTPSFGLAPAEPPRVQGLGSAAHFGSSALGSSGQSLPTRGMQYLKPPAALAPQTPSVKQAGGMAWPAPMPDLSYSATAPVGGSAMAPVGGSSAVPITSFAAVPISSFSVTAPLGGGSSAVPNFVFSAGGSAAAPVGGGSCSVPVHVDAAQDAAAKAAAARDAAAKAMAAVATASTRLGATGAATVASTGFPVNPLGSTGGTLASGAWTPPPLQAPPAQAAAGARPGEARYS